MTHLRLYGEKVDTFFHLLGKNENAMTKGLGWCLSQVPSFLDRLGRELKIPDLSDQQAIIKLQEHQSGTGRTDLEIHASGYAAFIIEAKRGITVPSTNQLEKYATRLVQLNDPNAKRGLVILAESDRNDRWLSQQLPDRIHNIPVHALSWRKVQQMAGEARRSAGHKGKRLLGEFQTYIKSETSMQNQYSNWVYVVSLNQDIFGGGNTTFIEVVEEYNMYFHPIGGEPSGWPVDPPNYLAFRYSGFLQSIHHVENYRIVTDLGPFFPDQPSKEEQNPLFLYQLGPPICPNNPTPTGARWRANRVWCFIDTLLTSETIAVAKTTTDERSAAMD